MKKKKPSQAQILANRKHLDSINKMTLFSKPVVKVKITPKKEEVMQDVIRSDRNHGKVFKSVSVDGVDKLKVPIRYDDEELAERERLAQIEVERKKKCMAPAYNKGAAQYVYSEEDAKYVGRK